MGRVPDDLTPTSAGIVPKRLGVIGPWSVRKLEVLRLYLGGEKGFLRAAQSSRERVYLDLFAGPGRNVVRGTGQEVDGSPLIALKTGPNSFNRLFWVDHNAENVASLVAHRRDYPHRYIHIYHGEANAIIDDVLLDVPHSGAIFAFLDPFGVELHWSTIEKLATHKSEPKIELFILYAFNQAIVRLLPNDPNRPPHEKLLDRLMPHPEKWRYFYQLRLKDLLTPGQFRREMLNLYLQGLRDLGYRYVLDPLLIQRSPRSNPLYFLVFASDHPAGRNIMHWCLGRVYKQVPQPGLFGYETEY